MKHYKLNGWIRVLLIVCGLSLIAVLVFPIWRIELNAPQYPEGLNLLIFANKLGGSVDIINGLNHYIGMKTLHTSDFFEFTALPYIISFFAGIFIIAGIWANRKFLNFAFILFLLFGVLAMVDFWKWEYNYGHNLDPNAAIIVPGMAYQPPLIGYKQLLNFGAFSVPDVGGWIFILVGLAVLVAVVAAWKYKKKSTLANTTDTPVSAVLLLLLFASCKAGPEPLRVGIDNCYYCKMMIADIRFGAEIVTKKGKVYKFDDASCLHSFLQQNEIKKDNIKDIYFADFSASHQLGKANDMFFCKTEAIKSPMGGNIVAFRSKDSMEKEMKQVDFELLSWEEINN